MNDRTLAQVHGDALKDLAVTALVAEFVRVAADAIVIPLLALLERIGYIVLRERDSVRAGSATDLLLLAAGAQVADSVAGGFFGHLGLSHLDAALLVFTLLVTVLVMLVLVLFVFARFTLGVCDGRAGRIGVADGCAGMLHHTAEFAAALVVCDHTVLARWACSRQLVSVPLLFEKLTASVRSTHDDGEFSQIGAIGNIIEYLSVVALVAKVGRVPFADGAIVETLALLQGLPDVIFRQGGAVGALEVAEWDALAELRKGRGMGQGHQSVEDDGFYVEKHFERLVLWRMV